MTGWLDGETTEWRGRPVARTVADVAARGWAVLTGEVRSVVARPAHRGPRPVGTSDRGASFDVVLDDGTGSIVARWVGRDGLPGVRAGVRMSVQGTVVAMRGRRVLLNPLYRFEAPPAASQNGDGAAGAPAEPEATGRPAPQDGSSVS